MTIPTFIYEQDYFYAELPNGQRHLLTTWDGEEKAREFFLSNGFDEASLPGRFQQDEMLQILQQMNFQFIQ